MNEHQSSSGEGGPDRVDLAMENLRQRLRRASDDPVRIELLEDDLREGRRALEEVDEFFGEVIALLSDRRASSSRYVDLADDPSVGQRLEVLSEAVHSLRRRLVQLAARN